MKLKKIAILVTAVCLLSSCAVKRINQQETANQTSYSSTANQLDQLDALSNTVKWTNAIYVSPTPIKQVKVTPIPTCTLSINSVSPITLKTLGGMITKSCGYPVQIINSSTEQKTTQYAPVNATSSSTPDIPYLKWNGSLSGLLDYVGSQTGLSWNFDGKTITFFGQETKTYTINLLDSQIDSKATVNSGSNTSTGTSSSSSGASDSGQNSSNQTSTIESKDDLYKDIESTIKVMLSSKGKYYLSPSTGTLTVTDSENVQNQIANYIDSINKKLNQQVLLKIQVVSVTTSESDGLGLNWNLIYKGIKTGGSLGGGAGSVTDSANPYTGAINILNGNFAGSSLMLNALSQQGTVKVLTTQYSTTTNLVPVTIQTADQTNYIASNSTTSTAQVGTQTTMTQGSVTTGFNMTVNPYIMNGNDVQLQVALHLSDPPVIRTVKSKDGTTEIEMPAVKSKSMTQRVDLKSGQTLIMSGTSQINGKTDKSGTLDPNNILLGGSLNGQSDNTVLIVLISPTVLGD